jgi:hypothetical protein
MRNTWTVYSEATGAVRITITADTDARGVSISNTNDWHSYNELALIASMLTEANAWMLANGGTE